MLKCPYCGSQNITALVPTGMSKPRKLYKYDFAQHCMECNKDFNKQSRLIPTREDPYKILFAQQLPSSGELKEQLIESK